jgi:nucleoside-diphosphate-sugar epimerase
MTLLLAPSNTKLQNDAAAAQQYPPVPKVCVVTGGTGFVGLRLVEMLVERGASKVISLDIVPPPEHAWKHPNIEWRVGDICDLDTVRELCKGADCVWHNAAAVGPFHPKPLYYKVNYEGTLNVIKACEEAGVKKIVMSSSPSTRFTGEDVDGLTEDQMPDLPLEKYLQPYAETKAMGEIQLLKLDQSKIMTMAVAPHQVYGPRDNLFLPNLLEAAGNGKLRVFGEGLNRICFTHVDNYCHGLIIAERALKPGSNALGKFYIVTDGTTHPNGEQYLVFWKIMDEAFVHMGFQSLWEKVHLPKWLLFGLAYICEFLGFVFQTTFKLNYFNVLVLTMHRWFDISAAEKDLDFKPIIGFREGWDDTKQWFKENWLPKFKKDRSLLGIADKTQEKIDIQAKKGQ